MTRDEWKTVIKSQMSVDSELLSSFETSLNILAEILEERDRVHAAYEEDGSRPVVEFKTDRGSVNMKPNPLLKQWQELNITALQYLRDLGLTAGGLRKLSGQLPKEKSCHTDSLEEFMKTYK